MRLFSIITIVVSLQFSSQLVAADTENENEILAKRGKGVITQEQFSARADRIPEHARFGTLRDRNRLRDVLNTLLLRAQLAEDAREAGFDKDPIVIGRMQLAADAELAEAWMQHYVATRGDADYEALAREYYLLHGDEMMAPASIDVSHVLISTEERPEADALALAQSIYQQIQEDPALFDELVTSYSEDPSASSNKGRFKNIKKGEMVGEFELAAFSLEAGEISEPVKTVFGYHIIRLDAHNAATQQKFEDVKSLLMQKQRDKHEERIRNDYLSSLTSLEVDLTEEALREMVKRQFGEEVLAPEAKPDNSE